MAKLADIRPDNFSIRCPGTTIPACSVECFRTWTPLVVDDGPLEELADAMKDPDPGDAAGNNTNVPAGFTYLGQFVDHDITLDLTSFGEKESDPNAVENFRTPALDLDSVYGLGPDGSRQLYARNPGELDGKSPGPKLLIGKTISVPVGNVTITPRNDLPRSPEGFALIGDHRNDENLLVAQTHLAMLKFHNKVCDQLAAAGTPVGEIFAQARQIVTWHYQWMVLHDFVERITEKGIVAKILEQGRRFYRFKTDALYAGGVLRGRLPARPQHGARGLQPQPHLHARCGGIPATLDLLFKFTGLSGGIVGDLAPNPVEPPLPLAGALRATGSSTGGASTKCWPPILPTCRSIPRANSIRSWCRSCIRCPAAAAACRSAI